MGAGTSRDAGMSARRGSRSVFGSRRQFLDKLRQQLAPQQVTKQHAAHLHVHPSSFARVLKPTATPAYESAARLNVATVEGWQPQNAAKFRSPSVVGGVTPASTRDATPSFAQGGTRFVQGPVFGKLTPGSSPSVVLLRDEEEIFKAYFPQHQRMRPESKKAIVDLLKSVLELQRQLTPFFSNRFDAQAESFKKHDEKLWKTLRDHGKNPSASVSGIQETIQRLSQRYVSAWQELQKVTKPHEGWLPSKSSQRTAGSKASPQVIAGLKAAAPRSPLTVGEQRKERQRRREYLRQRRDVLERQREAMAHLTTNPNHAQMLQNWNREFMKDFPDICHILAETATRYKHLRSRCDQEQRAQVQTSLESHRRNLMQTIDDFEGLYSTWRHSPLVQYAGFASAAANIARLKREMRRFHDDAHDLRRAIEYVKGIHAQLVETLTSIHRTHENRHTPTVQPAFKKFTWDTEKEAAHDAEKAEMVWQGRAPAAPGVGHSLLQRFMKAVT